jgi:hypothetical protein
MGRAIGPSEMDTTASGYLSGCWRVRRTGGTQELDDVARMGRQGFPQVMVAVHEQQASMRAGRGNALRIARTRHGIRSSMHHQDGACHAGDRVDRRDRVEFCADDPLHMPHHVPAHHGIGNPLLLQEGAHHFARMRECRQTHDGPDITLMRRVQQGCRCTDRVAQERQPIGRDAGLLLQPGKPGRDVFGEARHRCEGLIVAVSVAAGVEQQYREAGVVQGLHHGPHHAGIRAPSVHHEHGRCVAIDEAGRRHKPSRQGLCARADDV